MDLELISIDDEYQTRLKADGEEFPPGRRISQCASGATEKDLL